MDSLDCSTQHQDLCFADQTSSTTSTSKQHSNLCIQNWTTWTNSICLQSICMLTVCRNEKAKDKHIHPQKRGHTDRCCCHRHWGSSVVKWREVKYWDIMLIYEHRVLNEFSDFHAWKDAARSHRSIFNKDSCVVNALHVYVCMYCFVCVPCEGHKSQAEHLISLRQELTKSLLSGDNTRQHNCGLMSKLHF